LTAEAAVRVLVADDDRSTRAGIRLALAEHAFDVCAEAGSADDAVQAAEREDPDVCLIEADLPGGGGVATAGRILDARPGAAVIILSGAVDPEDLFAAVRAGVRGYLPKDMDPERLPAALRGVLEGEAAVPRALMGALLEEFRAREHGRHAGELARLGVELTARERQVLDLLDRGLDTAEIGERLSISAVTVRRHVSEILRKLGAGDRDAAAGLVADVLRRHPDLRAPLRDDPDLRGLVE
jgi:DNA-binding NarL/FixJ family response regulator